jgi:hypothetical protein
MAEEETGIEETMPAPEEASVAVEETPEADSEETAPDVGEALSQMRAEMQDIKGRLPEPQSETPDLLGALSNDEEWSDDDDEPAAGGENGPDEESDQFVGALQELIKEGIQESVLPHFQQMEAEKRETGIHQLAEKYPRLKEPEVVNAVAGELRKFGFDGTEDGLPPDPRLVEKFYKAYEAEAAASADTPAEAARQEGQALETGAGPSAPQEDDPDAEYKRLMFGSGGKRDAFS